MGLAVSASFTERGIAARRVALAMPRLAISPEEAERRQAERVAAFYHRANKVVDAIRYSKEEMLFSPKVARIINRFAGVNGVSKADIIGYSRRAEVVLVRQAICYWARRTTDKSLPEIGRRLGNRDHTTVLHSVREYPKKRALMGRHVRDLYALPRPVPTFSPLSRKDQA